MKNKTLKNKFKNCELTFGSWITIGHPSIVEVLSNMNFDWLVVDMEHTAIDYTMMQILISTIQSKDIAALVRVSKNEEVYIKKALDCGADGIIVPMVNSQKDAKKIIESSKYSPDGKRGVGLYRAQKYGFGFSEYINWVNDNLVIIGQIEHTNAINNLDSLIAGDYLDGFIIGPYDLSASLGCPGDFSNPDFLKYIKKFKDSCLKNNVSMGYHVVEPNPALVKSMIKDKFNFIALSTDFLLMGKKAQELFKEVKKD